MKTLNLQTSRRKNEFRKENIKEGKENKNRKYNVGQSRKRKIRS